MRYLAREWLKYHPQQASDWLWYCRKRRLPLYSQSEQAHLTVCVVVFERIQRWKRLAPNNANRILPESEPHEMEIYMHHPHDLFDVVMSV